MESGYYSVDQAHLQFCFCLMLLLTQPEEYLTSVLLRERLALWSGSGCHVAGWAQIQYLLVMHFIQPEDSLDTNPTSSLLCLLPCVAGSPAPGPIVREYFSVWSYLFASSCLHFFFSSAFAFEILPINKFVENM